MNVVMAAKLVMVVVMIGKLSLYKHAGMYGAWGGDAVPVILNLQPRRVGSQPHYPAPLPLGKQLPYLFISRLGGPQRLSGRFDREKSLALSRIRTPY